MSSQLRAFEDTLLNIKETSELKGSFESFVKKSDIRYADKAKLILNIRQCHSLDRLHKLFYNSLLKFEGQGVIA
jgi:hypothetical protein